MDTIKNLNLNEEIPNLEAVTSEHIEAISKTLEKKYLTFWKHKLENSSKLTFYSTFKTDHNLEKYLALIKDPYKRNSFHVLESATITSKLRSVDTKIYIPREECLCEICNSGEVESETHFLLYCKSYEHSREDLRSSLENASSNEIKLNSETLSSGIMKSTDSELEIITKLSKFVYSCFEQTLKYLETMSAN